MHVVRGQFTTGKKGIKIQLFDSKYNTAYKIVDFKISFSERSNINPESCSAKLTSFESPSAATVSWNWADTRELAWAYAVSDANSSVGAETSSTTIDPMNLVVEDVYLSGYSYADQEIFNYMIIFEKYKLDEFDGPIAMVRNRAD